MANTRLPPPGLPPMSIPPPGMRPPMNALPGMLPPGMLRLMPPHPQFLQNGPHRPGTFMFPPGTNQNQFPVSISISVYLPF